MPQAPVGTLVRRDESPTSYPPPPNDAGPHTTHQHHEHHDREQTNRQPSVPQQKPKHAEHDVRDPFDRAHIPRITRRFGMMAGEGSPCSTLSWAHTHPTEQDPECDNELDVRERRTRLATITHKHLESPKRDERFLSHAYTDRELPKPAKRFHPTFVQRTSQGRLARRVQAPGRAETGVRCRVGDVPNAPDWVLRRVLAARATRATTASSSASAASVKTDTPSASASPQSLRQVGLRRPRSIPDR